MIIPGAQLSEANEKKKLMVCLALVIKTLKEYAELKKKKRFLLKMHFLRYDLECEVYFNCTVRFDASCITEVLGSG